MPELIALLVEHGVLVVFVTTLAARIGAPVPASPLLVVAGGLGAAGQLSLAAVVAVSVVANIAGDALWFQAGRHYGHRVMRLLCRISLSPDTCVRQSEALIGRWGGSSLVAAKFVPGVSVVAAPMAGALGMSIGRFVAFEVLAALVWTGAFLALGMVFSTQIQQVLDVMAGTGAVAFGVLVLALAAAVALRLWRRRRFARSVEIERISVDQLHRLMQQGDAPVVIDVRSAASAQADGRRIPGAITVELDAVPAIAGELPRDRDIVLYCSCPNEVSAARAARLLADAGLVRARPLAGGLDAWVAAGKPLAEVVSVGDLALPVATAG
ncbi:DedA family protein/thiosulfate sulfurtransferase GlpE [Ideonella sp. BN130291]|uniref:DedA family protein/thiosulfate sulfurtransferase GlpE n=1 Tax=Ideonella sp. BN130291 TaxID=3112940 RepID=UPI002E26B02B|nr:DedA family protein/thiosulfate sulfurtransferase GlpE [Ideonella sp. BN130291]